MRSKPPHGQGRDRQDRKGQDHKGPGKHRGGKGHENRQPFGSKGGEHKGGDRKGAPFKGAAQNRSTTHKGPEHKGAVHKGGPKGRSHQGGFKKSYETKKFQAPAKQQAPSPYFNEPRPQVAPPAPAPEPVAKPVSRIDHGGTVDVWLYGHHAVSAALANQERRILRLLTTTEAMERLKADSSIPPSVLNRARSVSRREIDNIVGENAVHQGVAMLTRPIEHHLEDVLEIAKENPSCCVVMLDQVSDPHNVGAILRSAAAFNAAAVITLDRRAAAETGAMAKSASGALDRIAFVQITNLARAIEVLKQNQFWVIGLEADGEKKIAQVDLKGRIAFVLGTEGEGLRRLVKESCDEVVRLPINASAESLNVSNAAAVALYERSRQVDKT